MADNVSITAGAGTSIATDDIGGVQFQRVKLAVGPDGTHTADLAGRVVSGSDGAINVDIRPSRIDISQTPTISAASAYAAGDAVGGIMTFANAARAAGLGGVITKVAITDLAAQVADLELILWTTSPAGTFTDNAAIDPTDGDLQDYFIGIIPLAGCYSAFADNAAGSVVPNLSFVGASTSIFGTLVSRGTPTYASTTDIEITLTIVRD